MIGIWKALRRPQRPTGCLSTPRWRQICFHHRAKILPLHYGQPIAPEPTFALRRDAQGYRKTAFVLTWTAFRIRGFDPKEQSRKTMDTSAPEPVLPV